MFTSKMSFVYRVLSVMLIALSVTCVLERNCLKITQIECANFFYGRPNGSAPPLNSTFPNNRNLNVLEAFQEFGNFRDLLSLDNYCSHLLHSFLCFHYFPTCDPTNAGGRMVVPCRSVCEEAMMECLDHVYSNYNVPRPDHLDCDNFPVASTDDDDFIVACPTPAIHLDFGLPLELKSYTVLESDGQVEVCVKVASTGRHCKLHCPVYVDITLCSDTATGEDYEWIKHTLVFEIGSVKGDRNCFNINITEDLISEQDERFYVHAHMYTNGSWPGAKSKGVFGSRTENRTGNGTGGSWSESGSGSGSGNGTPNRTGNGTRSRSGSKSTSDGSPKVDDLRFGGALSSRTGRIAVSIIDNDVCHIPQKYCARVCHQRTKANGRTFPNNSYTFAARIKLLGIRNYSMCTAIEVLIIQCWDIKRNPCPSPNTLHVIPTCAECPSLSLVVDNHYLIAGIRHKIKKMKRLILPGQKSIGLFAEWDDRKFADIDTWVNQARSG